MTNSLSPPVPSYIRIIENNLHELATGYFETECDLALHLQKSPALAQLLVSFLTSRMANTFTGLIIDPRSGDDRLSKILRSLPRKAVLTSHVTNQPHPYQVDLSTLVAQILPPNAPPLGIENRLCIFTSGSTGSPKGVVIAPDDLQKRIATEINLFNLTPEDTILCVLPLSFDVGLTQTLATLFTNAQLRFTQAWFPNDIVKEISTHNITGMALSPIIWKTLLSAKNQDEIWAALVNFSSMSAEVGVSYKTIQAWLSVLEASYIIKRVQPWHANLKKRMVKSPKLYFYDVGLAAYLIGIQNADQLQAHPLRGALFENMMVAEAFKQQYNHGHRQPLSFFRDSQGNEVDLLIETGAGLNAYEIKSAQTIGSDFFKGLNYLQKLKVPIAQTHLIYGGDQSRTQSGHTVQSWRNAIFK